MTTKSTKYEYRILTSEQIVRASGRQIDTGQPTDELMKFHVGLNKLGEEGWLLQTMFPPIDIHIFAREVIDDDGEAEESIALKTGS